jgi:hypothetical protein
MIFFFDDEAWFHLLGYLNSQNIRMWSAENPHFFQELHITVWCQNILEKLMSCIMAIFSKMGQQLIQLG